MVAQLEWSNPSLYLLAVLGALAQTLKVEGSTNRTNYSIAWFVYGFTFIAFGLAASHVCDRLFPSRGVDLAQVPVVYPGLQHRKPSHLCFPGMVGV